MIDFNVANYLRLNVQDMVMTLVSTVLIVLFAKHFFWDKILAFVKKRQDLIQANIDSSEDLKKAAFAQKEKYDLQMQHAGKDARMIIETARANANQQKQEILDKANVEASRIKAKAYEDMDRERLKAQDEMKETISDVALEAAKQLVDKEMDANTQRQFVDDFLAKAGNQK